MKIGLLTSSRADFGIYFPLVKELMKDSFFELEIIAFGTHLSEKYGFTVSEIEKQGFKVKHKIETLPQGDSAYAISSAMGETMQKFSTFWNCETFDLVLALGDRYEMFAAVSAASPFNIEIAHIHAGETTLGAIDNAYRHSISLMSKYLFVSTDTYRQRAIEINQDAERVFNVGALSIDNLKKQRLFSLEEFKDEFDIDLNKPSVLSTFHPETMSLAANEHYIHELIESFQALQTRYQIIITMPNSDTMGLMIRKELEAFGRDNPQIKIVESFGMKGYLSCMKHCRFLLGNTSSGFVEAAFFPKWVINLGDRQKGRILTQNIVNSKTSKHEIITIVNFIENNPVPKNVNIYGEGNTTQKIIKSLKEL